MSKNKKIYHLLLLTCHHLISAKAVDRKPAENILLLKLQKNPSNSIFHAEEVVCISKAHQATKRCQIMKKSST